jgi:anti-sigma-K factor RskA
MDIRQYIASGIIETYVMGLCTREEELEMETLRRQYPELNNAVIRYEEELEKNMQQHITLPPEKTDDKILKKLDSLNIPVVPINVAGNNKDKNRWIKVAAAAAVVFLAISSFFNYILYNKINEQELALIEAKNTTATLPPEDYTILKDPAITPVAMYGVGIHSICRCTMFWDKKTGKMYIMIHHLPLSSSSKDYQLWAMVDGNPVNVGIIQDEIRGRFIEMQNVPANAVAFTVTLEKAGGSETPTTQQTYLSGKI